MSATVSSTVDAARITPPGPAGDLAGRVAGLDRAALARQLDDAGGALTGPLLTPAECAEIAGWYGDDHRFRSTVDMARLRFGAGQYRYFANPLPGPVAELRAAFWPLLLPIARDWAARLLLRYGPGDWNALHQDLYGELYFPLQVVIGLDAPGADHTGGEFLLVEQRPRAQSRGTSLVLGQGQALVFTTRARPVRSSRGWSAPRPKPTTDTRT